MPHPRLVFPYLQSRARYLNNIWLDDLPPRCIFAWSLTVVSPEGFRRQDIVPEANEEHCTVIKDQLLGKYDVALLTGEEIIEESRSGMRHGFRSCCGGWMRTTKPCGSRLCGSNASEYDRDHIRMGTQPLDQPDSLK